MKKSLSPFHGYPATMQHIDDDGNLAFRVEPIYTTPNRARFADTIGAAGLILIIISAIAHSFDKPHAAGLEWVTAVMFFALFIIPIQILWRFIFKSHIRLELTEEHFIVRGGLCGTKQFDRTLPHKFTVLPHDKAEEERENHLFAERQAQSKGQLIKKKKYYGDSYHISYEYLGQRNDILTVMSKKDALAIVARLKAIDDVLNANSGQSEGIFLSPEDEWDDNAGDIE